MAVAEKLTGSEVRQHLQDGSLVGTWILDPTHSSATFRTKSMWGMVRVVGAFQRLTGTATVSAEGGVSGGITIDAASLDTKNAKRDKHLRSADFFDVAKFPQITFALTTVTPAADGLTVEGALTVRDTTLPISFPAKPSLTDTTGAGFHADVTIDRSKFGIRWNPMHLASLENVVTVELAFTRS